MSRDISASEPDVAGSLPQLRIAELDAGAKELAAIADRRRKVDLLRRMGTDPFPRRFHSRTPIAEVREDRAGDGRASDDNPRSAPAYRVAGRLISCRRHRRAAFLDLRDQSGEIEAICLLEDLGEAAFDMLSHIDVGDILGVAGVLVTTRRGEPALQVGEVVILGKSLTLPPQADGRDPRDYVRPEVALMASDEAQRILRMRIDLMAHIRSWFGARAYLEVETPILLPLASGAAARPFVTEGNALGSDLYLRIATEQHLKRWVIGGFDRVFEIARCFRNEGMSQRHHFEFTMLEWMEGYADYHGAMSLIENLVHDCAVAMTGSSEIRYRGETVDLTPPWRRVTVREAVAETIEMDIMDADRGRLAGLLDGSADVDVPWPDLVGTIYSKLVETRFIQPTFVTDFPRELFPLAKKKPGDAFAAEAFEAVVGGIEIATGVTSINDVDEQRVRFAEQRARQEGRPISAEDRDLDEDFLQALAYGMMPATCAGIGVDRLLMLLIGARGLRDVIPFPTLRGKPRFDSAEA